MFDYFAITLSYHTLLSVIWQPYTFCCCILAASDNIYRFILYGVWNAWPLFFPWRFSILLGKWGPPLLFFFWVFVLFSSQFSVCVLVFQSTWPSRTFIILKDTNLGTGICLISDFLACHRDRKSWKMSQSPLQKVATNKN